MVDNPYSANIKNLFQDYYKRNISFTDYRKQRKILIDQMEVKYNGLQSHPNDITQPNINRS